MVQVILGNMWICLGPSLPEPGVLLQISSMGDTEWKARASKMYARGHIRGINNGDAGSLDI